MTSDHNRSELRIHDHSNEPSSSKLVPKVVPLAVKTATSRQKLELLFHHHIAMLRTTVFMGKEKRNFLSKHIMWLVDDFDAWNDFPWGEYMWDKFYQRTLNVVSKHTEYHLAELKKNLNFNATYNLYGFAWAFKLSNPNVALISSPEEMMQSWFMASVDFIKGLADQDDKFIQDDEARVNCIEHNNGMCGDTEVGYFVQVKEARVNGIEHQHGMCGDTEDGNFVEGIEETICPKTNQIFPAYVDTTYIIVSLLTILDLEFNQGSNILTAKGLNTEANARRNNEKALNILLSAIPDRHLLSFHDAEDAKTLWSAIKARFGVATMIRGQPGLDELEFDDLYNNLKVHDWSMEIDTEPMSTLDKMDLVILTGATSADDTPVSLALMATNSEVTSKSNAKSVFLIQGTARQRLPQSSLLSQRRKILISKEMDNIRQNKPYNLKFFTSTRTSTTRTPHRTTKHPRKLMKLYWVKIERTVGIHKQYFHKNQSRRRISRLCYKKTVEALGRSEQIKDKQSELKEYKWWYMRLNGNDPKRRHKSHEKEPSNTGIDFEKVSY
ncbi:hypothetical protein Tco_1375363 [Tanacetum coccineum]